MENQLNAALYALLNKALEDMAAMAESSPCCKCIHKNFAESGCFGGGHCKEFQWDYALEAQKALNGTAKEITDSQMLTVTVRCGECRHYQDGICNFRSRLANCEGCEFKDSWNDNKCTLYSEETDQCKQKHIIKTNPDDFCSYGERA